MYSPALRERLRRQGRCSTPSTADSPRSVSSPRQGGQNGDAIQSKRELLERLQLVQRYRQQNALAELDELIPKWLEACQTVAGRLYALLDEPKPPLGTFLRNLNVDLKLVQFDEANDRFQ